MAVDKKLLKRLRILYVEDDDNIRGELSGLLANFFDKVYTAENGQIGLDTFSENQDNIDVILSDINMPELSGIEMMQKIREFNEKIPIIFATAYSDNEFLAEAIKIKVYDYIIKPIDIRNLLTVMNELAGSLYKDFMINQQNEELEKYKDVIDSNNIMMKLDTKGNITYINKHFCTTTGYSEEELLNKPFISLKHNDTSELIFKDMYEKTLSGKSWKGQIKNYKKNGEPFIVDIYTIADTTTSGEVIGIISVQKDITQEINQKRDVQKSLMKSKSKIFLEGKETSTELLSEIEYLKNTVIEKEGLYKQAIQAKDKIKHSTEKIRVEYKRLQIQLVQCKKEAELMSSRNAGVLKTNKELVDSKQDLRKARQKIIQLEDTVTKGFSQERVKYDIKIDDLEKELFEAQAKLDELGDVTAFTQKLEYWKEKAKDEAQRAEELEKKIMQHADKSVLKKLFG